MAGAGVLSTAPLLGHYESATTASQAIPQSQVMERCYGNGKSAVLDVLIAMRRTALLFVGDDQGSCRLYPDQ